MDEVCTCESAEICKCPNSFWMPMQFQSPAAQFPPGVIYPNYPSYYSGSPMPGPFQSGFYHQFMLDPSFGIASPAHSSAYSTPTAYYPATNTIPFPFTDRTNTPTQPPARAGAKCPRSAALSGNAQPPKRVRVRESTMSNPRVSVSAATSCGFGPSTPLPRTPATNRPRSPSRRNGASPNTPVAPPR